MKFRAEEYFSASVERMRQARTIWSDGNSFALSMYCAGLAVESLLRAFRWTEETSFEGRHDLLELLGASRLQKIDDDYMRRRGVSEDEIRESSLRIRQAMNEVVALWNNTLRFASESSARAFLRRIDQVQGIKGDPLRKNARDLVEAAQTIVDRGVTLWAQKTKS